MAELDAEPLRNREDTLVPVELEVADAAQPSVRDHLETGPAGRGGHVNRAAIDHYPVLGSLDDGVGLGVDGGDAVVVLHHVPYIGAVGHPADGAVVAGR